MEQTILCIRRSEPHGHRVSAHAQQRHGTCRCLPGMRRKGRQTMNFRLGRKPARHDPRTLQFAKYAAGMPSPPASVDNTYGLGAFGMLGNDFCGDCTIAAALHAIQTWHLSLTGRQFLPFSDALALSYYSKWAGYVPGDPATDQGAVELDVLNLWRKSTLADHNLKAFCDPSPHNIDHIKKAIWAFGGVYIGIDFPSNASEEPGSVWDYDPAASIIGGHAVFCPLYSPRGIGCISWGNLYTMTWDFWANLTEESHCLMSDTDWMNRDQTMFDYAALLADLPAVSS